MEQKQQYLASMGHYIRKLNQAYFAYYGTYADRSTSISPIGLDLKELRSQSASLEGFPKHSCRNDQSSGPNGQC